MDKKEELEKELARVTQSLDGIIMEIGKLKADQIKNPNDGKLQAEIDGKTVQFKRIEARKVEIEQELRTL